MRCPIVALLGLAGGLVALDVAAVEVAVQGNGARPVGEAIEFSAAAQGTGELSYTWNFGDGQSSEASSEASALHVYEQPGHYPVIVVVRDETGGVRSDSFLQTVHRPLPATAPTSSSTIVYHRDWGQVCNVNADNDTVSCLSTDDLELVFEAPVGRHPRTLAVAPDGMLWVASQDDATISVLDATGALVDQIELPRASKPFGLAMNPRGGKAYVTLQALGQLAEIDVVSHEVLRQVTAGPWATGVAVDASGTRIFVTRFISASDRGEMVELSSESLLEVRRHPLSMDESGPDTEATSRGVPNYLRSVVPSPDGALLWVPSKQDNVLRGLVRDGEGLTFETTVRTVVSLVDLETNEELSDERVDLNNRTLGLGLTFSPLGDYAFVALLGNNGVEVFDAYDRSIVAGQFELGKAPDGLVLDDQGRLYVNAYLSRSVFVLDAAPLLASEDFRLEPIAEVVVSVAERLEPNVLLGKQIFYDASDPRMAQDGYVSCAVCHLDGFEDGRVWDFTDRGEGLRNTTSLLGRRGTGQGRLHWSANFDEVQDFEHDIRGAFGGTGFLPDDLFNQGTRNQTLGDAKAGLSPELDAMAAYVASLDRVNPSPFRDPDGSLTEAGWRGLDLFVSSGCTACHGGADFTDSSQGVVHDVGTMTGLSGSRLGETLTGIDTPTLRGIWETAPYLHDGSAATLLDVIETRNPDDRHGSTQGLSPDQRADLVSYLLQIDNVALEDEAEPEPEPEPAPAEPAPGAAPASGSSRSPGCSAGSSQPPNGPGGALTLAGLLVLLRSSSRKRRATSR